MTYGSEENALDSLNDIVKVTVGQNGKVENFVLIVEIIWKNFKLSLVMTLSEFFVQKLRSVCRTITKKIGTFCSIVTGKLRN